MIPSPGRSQEQSLHGTGLHDPLYVIVKLAPNRTPFTRGLVTYVPRKRYFRVTPPKTGKNSSLPPAIG